MPRGVVGSQSIRGVRVEPIPLVTCAPWRKGVANPAQPDAAGGFGKLSILSAELVRAPRVRRSKVEDAPWRTVRGGRGGELFGLPPFLRTLR